MAETGLRSEKEAKDAKKIPASNIQMPGANIHVKRLASAKYPAPITNGIAYHNGERHAKATNAAPIQAADEWDLV